MKNLFVSFVIMFALVSCKGGGGDGANPELNPLLFTGSATYELSYDQGSAHYTETLQFVGDECFYRTEVVALGSGMPISDTTKTLKLTPLSASKAKGVNVDDSTEVWTWTYTLNGNVLRLCDDMICLDYTRL